MPNSQVCVPLIFHHQSLGSVCLAFACVSQAAAGTIRRETGCLSMRTSIDSVGCGLAAGILIRRDISQSHGVRKESVCYVSASIVFRFDPMFGYSYI